MKRTVTIVGPLTDEDLRQIIVAVQGIEARRPEETFHVVLDDPTNTQEAEEFIEKINPLRRGYERVTRMRRL